MCQLLFFITLSLFFCFLYYRKQINSLLWLAVFSLVFTALVRPENCIFIPLFFIGFYFLFLLVKKMFNEGIAFYSLIFLLFLPRFMAHAHYNSKDIPIAAFSIISFYFLYLGFKQKKTFSSFIS